MSALATLLLEAYKSELVCVILSIILSNGLRIDNELGYVK